MRSFFQTANVTALVLMLTGVKSQWTLNLLSSDTYPLARCLDGTQGGYYISPGSGADAANVLWHFQGGGWCVSDQDCANRAKSALGSSSFWAASGCPNSNSPVCYADGGASGMLSNDPAQNPHLANWTKIFVAYCDGSSYASDILDPVVVGSQTIYYRGSYILDAVFTDLFVKHGLAASKTFVVAGCSAGGLASYIHVDDLCNRAIALNPNIRCVGAPGAGFFMGEAAAYNGGSGYLANYQWVFSRMNISTHTNDACILNHTIGDKALWKCYIAPEVLPFISTPIFVSNSLTDSWQIGNIMDVSCNPSNANGGCSSAEIQYLSTFRDNMISALGPVTAKGSKHGGFLQGCFVHVVEDVGQWTTVKINGQTQSDSFWSWFIGDGVTPLQIGTFPPWSNPTC